MNNYEYTTFRTPATYPDLDDEINAYAKLGWRLITDTYSASYHIIFFERELRS